MKKSVLIITPFFAPQTHAAVFRAYKLAKYLPRFGWKPYVLTVDTNYLYNEDPSLLTALSPEVEITRVKYIEPTLRGLRMALGGKDRTFKRLKDQGFFEIEESFENKENAHGIFRRIYNYFLDAWFQNPDAYWTWYGPAVRAARKLIRQRNIPLLFTSADPFTCHRIGLTLKKEGTRWVADLRDPHTYCHQTYSGHPLVYARQRKAERDAVLNADAVTVASPAIAMILTDTYGLSANHPLHFIPTGLDETLLPPVETHQPKKYPYIVFSGEFLPAYGDDFLDIFARTMAMPQLGEKGFKLIFVGREEINRMWVTPILNRLGIGRYIEFVDHMPQQQLYELLQRAEAAVLISSPYYRWWCLYAKMVDYIALRKPVLALVPDPSVARSVLTRAGLGIFFDGDHNACAKRLADFLLGKMTLPLPNEEECNRYLAGQQVRSFSAVFDSLLEN